MKCKKTIDFRKLSRKDKEELRFGAIQRIEAGESPEAVADGLGVNRRAIYKWLEQFHDGGWDALKANPIPGREPKVSAGQMEKLAHIVHHNNPQQFRFEFALWTLGMIREVIRDEFGVRLSEVSVGRLMKRLGFTPQRPLHRAWQQDPQLIDEWRENTYPQIAARAKREQALIFFADESGIRSDDHAGTSWAPAGPRPVVKATGARHSMNMISAVNPRGQFRFMTVEGGVTARVFRQFLQRLIQGVDRKIFLIVDGHPAHKAKLVRQFVEAHSDSIELFYLPPYAPELNPDELAWAHVKSKVGKAATQTGESMRAAAFRALAQLQKSPDIVASFFRSPSCRYACV
jgi:transposase